MSGQGQFAEILYILRPVIYALAMQRWSKNKKSWSPWLIGFALEYGSRQLAKRDLAERAAGGLRGLTGLEREELKKRGWAMGWWMMRGAFYENITRFVLPLPKSCCSFSFANFCQALDCRHRRQTQGQASVGHCRRVTGRLRISLGQLLLFDS